MSIIYWGIFAVILFLIGVASFSISDKVYYRMAKAGKRSAKTIRILTFIFCYVLILAVIWLIAAMTFMFER